MARPVTRTVLAALSLALLPACSNFQGERTVEVRNTGAASLGLTWRQAWTNTLPGPEPADQRLRLAPGESATITYEPGDRLSIYPEDFSGSPGPYASVKLEGDLTTIDARLVGDAIELTTD